MSKRGRSPEKDDQSVTPDRRQKGEKAPPAAASGPIQVVVEVVADDPEDSGQSPSRSQSSLLAASFASRQGTTSPAANASAAVKSGTPPGVDATGGGTSKRAGPLFSSSALAAHNNTIANNNSAAYNSVNGGAGKEKDLKQTKIHFGLSQDEHLRRLVAERETTIQERDAAISELQHRIANLESELLYVRSSHENVSSDRSAQELSVSRYRSVLADVMIESARTSRREARRIEYNNHFELGQILSMQTATGSRELWVEGNRKRELDVELTHLNAKITEVETAKAAADKRLRSTTRGGASGSGGNAGDQQLLLSSLTDADASNGLGLAESVMEAEDQVQMLKHELDALRASKAETERRLSELQAAKTAFLKEIRRINDEDSSDFASCAAIGAHRQYVLLSLLGKGGFSEVWKSFDLDSARYVACKIHRVNKDWSRHTREHYLRHAERELAIMRGLKHSRLTHLYDVFEHDDNTFVSVQEISEGTDLDTYLKKNGRMREADARIIMIQLVSALRYLAEQPEPIIHYDLKPANILFHSPYPSCLDIKVTDFGLSKVIKETGNSGDPSIELTSQGTGTYWYLPPECFETGSGSPPVISNKVDIWAVGIIFFQLLFGKRPFAEGESQRRIWQEKLILTSARVLDFPSEPKISDGAREFIRKCLRYSAAERPDIVTLSGDPYLRVKKRGGGSTTSVAPSTKAMLPPPVPGVAAATAASPE